MQLNWETMESSFTSKYGLTLFFIEMIVRMVINRTNSLWHYALQ